MADDSWAGRDVAKLPRRRNDNIIKRRLLGSSRRRYRVLDRGSRRVGSRLKVDGFYSRVSAELSATMLHHFVEYLPVAALDGNCAIRGKRDLVDVTLASLFFKMADGYVPLFPNRVYGSSSRRS